MEILAAEDLLSAVEKGTFIKDGRKESCEGIKYDFTLSNMALTVDSKGPIDIDQEKEKAVIKPGEFAFIITKESLALPENIYCQLSTKRKLSLEGIILLGGLIIDPKYEGKLVFGLYNLSSHDFLLRSGKKLIAGVFYRINQNIDIRPDPINDFPDELIKLMLDSKPNSINAINVVLEELKAEIQTIKRQITYDDQWKTDFQKGMSDLQELVTTISKKLDTEIDERKDYDRKLEVRTSVIRGIGLVLSFIFGGGLVSLIVLYVAKILRFN
jgi:deoxycytidine triphosphate deaminase